MHERTLSLAAEKRLRGREKIKNFRNLLLLASRIGKNVQSFECHAYRMYRNWAILLASYPLRYSLLISRPDFEVIHPFSRNRAKTILWDTSLSNKIAKSSIAVPGAEGSLRKKSDIGWRSLLTNALIILEDMGGSVSDASQHRMKNWFLSRLLDGKNAIRKNFHLGKKNPWTSGPSSN